jgi:CO/xanthine dehydrogenase FAD-binding subunit
MDYIVARSVAETITAVVDFGGKARIIAGGTALQLAWSDGRADCPLIDIACVDMGPPASTTEDGALRLAANATLEDIRLDPLVQDRLLVLSQAIADVAAPGVRNLATIGGNLCWRAGDLVPLLLVLEARVVGAERGSFTIEDWLALERNDLVTAIEIPVPVKRRVLWEKVGRRASFSPSLITVAAVLELNAEGEAADARLAVGGGPTPPARLLDIESDLRAMAASALNFEDLALRIAADVRSADDPVGTAVHRARIAGRVLSHSIVGACAQGRVVA